MTWGARHLLDYVGLDSSPEPELEIIRMSPTIATHTNGTNVANALRFADDSIVKLNYGERLNLHYPIPTSSGSQRLTPVLLVTGEYVPIEIPVAALRVNLTEVQTYESVTFNASESTSPDGTVAQYLFEFGDGTNSGWIDSPVVTHEYTDGEATYLSHVTVRNIEGLVSVNSYNASIFIMVHNRPPSPDIQIYQEVNVTLTIDGRKDNAAYVRVYEDGMLVQNTGVVRTVGPPSSVTFTIKKYLDKTYEIELVYDADARGSNPIWLEFHSGMAELIFFKEFNTRNGYNQTVIVPASYLEGVTEKNPRFCFDASDSYDIDGEIVSYLWEFGDGVTSNESAPEHRYSANGEYVVRLTVTDDDGLATTVERVIMVVEFRPTLRCYGQR
jgi:PKD repeat protein